MATVIKKMFFALIALVLLFKIGSAQENRFNAELDKFCKTIIKEDFRTIQKERKAILDGMANQLAAKKYILFTCKTNSRRTVLLQVWAQTSFYYYGVYGKSAFSIGDTVTDVYPGVVDVLKESGFYCTGQKNVEPNTYVILISKDYPINLLTSKDELGTIDTVKGVVVNICSDDEQSGISAAVGHVNLPYKSPARYENTSREKQKYRILNHQIAAEMLYLSRKLKEVAKALGNALEY